MDDNRMSDKEILYAYLKEMSLPLPVDSGAEDLLLILVSGLRKQGPRINSGWELVC